MKIRNIQHSIAYVFINSVLDKIQYTIEVRKLLQKITLTSSETKFRVTFDSRAVPKDKNLINE